MYAVHVNALENSKLGYEYVRIDADELLQLHSER
jgi:hypothetical protein